jgi:hypothetical protein
MVRKGENDGTECATNMEIQVFLNKRKPVHLIPNPTNIPENAEVGNTWLMDGRLRLTSSR